MRRRNMGSVGLTALLSVLLITPAQAVESIVAPSGQSLTLSEVLLDDAPGAMWVRFRFVAPQIARDGGSVDAGMVSGDMDYLCHALALPYLDHHRIEAARVVISLSDRVVAFGQTLPAATQFFETYTPENGNCIWEEF